MVNNLRTNLFDIPHRFIVSVSDVQMLPFMSACFDVVIANHMLYHVPNLTDALKEIKRVLKQDGKFYASTNAVGNMPELYELVRTFGGNHEQGVRTFNLQNGCSVLSDFFAVVVPETYDDILHVTEVDPIINYVCSDWDINNSHAKADLKGFRAHVQHAISATGVFQIATHSGMFVAYGTP